MKMMPPDVISHEDQLQHLSEPSIFMLDVFQTADHAGQIFVPHRLSSDQRRDLGRTVTIHYNLPSRDDECLSTFLRGLLPVLRRSTVGLRVSSSTARDCSSAAPCVCGRCRQYLLYPIDTTWQRDSECPYHLSAGNLRDSFSCV